MSKTKIEWAGESWNPLRARNNATGGVGHFCGKVSAGCKNCYSENFQKRFRNFIQFGKQDISKVELFLDNDVLMEPTRWRTPRTVFPCSMTDIFGEWVPFEHIDAIFRVMADNDRHTFRVLTKRVDVALAFQQWKNEQIGGRWHMPPNVQMGTSVEDQPQADIRVPKLLQLRARVLFLSCEPLLGPLNLFHVAAPADPEAPDEKYFFDALNYNGGYEWEYEPGMFEPVDGPTHPGLSWIIVGGESGPGARPMHPDWARQLRSQCADAGVPFFFKQWGAWAPSGSCVRPYRGEKLGAFCVDGSWREGNIVHYAHPLGIGKDYMIRVGKKAAGRMLDDREWNEMPVKEAAKS